MAILPHRGFGGIRAERANEGIQINVNCLQTVQAVVEGGHRLALSCAMSKRTERCTMVTTRASLTALGFALCVALAQLAAAQEVLPRPEQPFNGHVGRTVKDSTKDFPREPAAPKGAPNVLLILTDDVGFGASSTFG